jgi:hypothetical protein
MAGANANHRDLSDGVKGFEAIASCCFAIIDTKSSCLNVDRHNLAILTFLNLLAHLRFINLTITSGEFLFAVAGLSSNHQRLNLISTVTL